MKIVIQRVSEASVKVNNEITGEISKGLLLLVGVEEEDSQEDADWLAKKILDLRIFSDEEGKMNHSVKDINGNRPSFIKSAKPEKAVPLFEYFKGLIKKSGLKTESGIFGADMKVSLLNDGPVTIVMDSKTKS